MEEVMQILVAISIHDGGQEGKRMRTFSTLDGRCPVCESEIEEVNRGFGVIEPQPCSCGWENGDEVLICDFCGEVSDRLIDMADGNEYCVDCSEGDVPVADYEAPVSELQVV